MPAVGDRRDRRLPARVEREPRRRVRRQPPQRRARRARARDRRALPRLPDRGDDLRPEHDDAQLRAHARARAELAAGDEILFTRLDHDGNVSPWLELAHDLDLGSTSSRSTRTRPRPRRPRATAERAHARRRLPARSNAVGTMPDARDRRARARGRALAWVDAVHYAPHGPIDVRGAGRRRPPLLALQVLRPAPRARLRPRGAAARRGGRTRCGPRRTSRSARRFETGTLAHELLAGFVAAVEYLDELGWDASASTSARSGSASSTGSRQLRRSTGSRRWTAVSRRSPSASTASRRARSPSGSPRADRGLGRRLLRRRGDEALGLSPTAPSAVGIVHYNTFEEVDRSSPRSLTL